MAVGIKKIKPLSRVRVLCACGIFIIWQFHIPASDFMLYISGLVILPSLVEVILEIRNFFKKRREMKRNSRNIGRIPAIAIARTTSPLNNESNGVHRENESL